VLGDELVGEGAAALAEADAVGAPVEVVDLPFDQAAFEETADAVGDAGTGDGGQFAQFGGGESGGRGAAAPLKRPRAGSCAVAVRRKNTVRRRASR